MTLDVLAEPDRLSALLARSRRNVERSRWFVATAEGLVRRTLRLRRPTFAGGSDSLEAEPPRAESLRALRTRQKVARDALPLHASGRRRGRGGLPRRPHPETPPRMLYRVGELRARVAK